MSSTVREFVNQLKSSKDTRDTPRIPTHVRSPHQFYMPYPMTEQMTEHPGKAILPCGCTRSHVLVQKLDTIPEKPRIYPSEASEFSITKSDTQEKSSLQRVDTDFDFDFDCPFPKHTRVEFRYYLPQISTSTTDLYTDCDWIAYDTIESSEQPERQGSLLSSCPEDMELPSPISGDGWNYYPETETYYSTDEDQLERMERKKVQKKNLRDLLRVFGKMRIEGSEKWGWNKP